MIDISDLYTSNHTMSGNVHFIYDYLEERQGFNQVFYLNDPDLEITTT